MCGKRREAKIISETERVVQLPYRHYPAFAVQGDTLAVWALRIDEIATLAKQSGNAELIAKCQTLRSQVVDALQSYNRVCQDNGGTGLKVDLAE